MDSYTEKSDGSVDFAANGLREFTLTGTLRAISTEEYGVSDATWDDTAGTFYQGPMVLSVRPIPEPVFFQMGALMGLSGLGLLRLRRQA